MARYRFDDFAVDPTERHLWRRAEQVRLSPKVYDLLMVLVRNPGRLLTKEVLLSAV